MNDIGEITDSMKNFFPEEDVDITMAICINNAFEYFKSEESSFDSLFGTGWNKVTINLDNLWEIYLSERNLLDEDSINMMWESLGSMDLT